MERREDIVVWTTWCARDTVDGKDADEVLHLLMEAFSGELLQVLNTVRVVPDRNND